ncbi:hypothetical protein V8C35DRAFT_333868 [Trichoderma chlorosporum]
MPLFNRPRSSSQPLVRRISTLVRRRLSITMANQPSSLPSDATPNNDTSSTSSISALMDALLLEASSTPLSSNSSTQSIDQESQTNAVGLHDDPSSQTSPTYTFAALNSHPNPLSQAIYTTYTPMPAEERLQRRQDCISRLHHLHQGLTQDPFGEWTDLAHGLFGGTIPPEFYLTSAPFTLHSLRGRVRLRYIRNALCMPTDATALQIESFLSRNPSIVRFLFFNVLPDPDHAYKEISCEYQIHVSHHMSKNNNGHLLRAIKQLDWVDETVDRVAELARTEDGRALSTLYKVREVKILPGVWKRMLEMEDKSQPMKIERLHTRVVIQMQRERPNSLLRNAIAPQDVVEKVL